MAATYPFDPSGTSAANRIVNEQHVITSQNFRDYHYVIPKFAPFFERDFTIRLQYPNGTIRTLTLGVDYYFSNQFLDASRACAKPIYGSISFLDTDTAGILSISYNTVGGMWNVSPEEISRILAEEMRNPRITTWEQVTYLPERFPVINHPWDLVDMVGASSVVTAIDGVRDAIAEASGGGLTEHVNNYSNPHNVTKAQVGLGNVANYAVASLVDAQSGLSNGFFMTPLRTRDAISAIGGAMLKVHTDDINNPHATTKAQVGLSNVQNYPVSTQPDAEAGALDIVYMTPLKTAQAIAAQVGKAYAAHAANQLNPHNVTKDQVGLFNVQNYAVATQEEARAGTLNDRYMTPLRTTQLVAEYVATNVEGHAQRTDNPHSVTKGQVGLANVENYALATQAEAQAGISNTTYMSPGRTRDSINALATPIGHVSDQNNPHVVTKGQVGLSSVENYTIATQVEAEAAIANDRYMTPLRTKQLVAKYVTTELDGHATRTDNPHLTTAAQVGLGNVQNYGIATETDATTGTSNTVYMTPARTKMAIETFALSNAHVMDYSNPHKVTAVQVGAYTSGEVDTLLTNYVGRAEQWVAGQTKTDFVAEVLTGTIANSNKLEGKTLLQITDDLEHEFEPIFANTRFLFSRDSAKTETTISSATNPHRWIRIGIAVPVPLLEQGATHSIDTTYPDAYWMVSGAHPQDAVDNPAASSPTYLIHAKSGVDISDIAFNVTRLNGTADSNVQFGYTFAAGELSVWIRTGHGHNQLQTVRLTHLGTDGSIADVDAEVIVAPTGITYVSPVSYATQASMDTLAQRVTDIETILNSIVVE